MQIRFLPTCLAILSIFFQGSSVSAAGPAAAGQEIFSLRIYQLKSAQQEERLDKFLKEAYLPALHRQGIAKVGVFKPVGNDTAAIRKTYVLMSFHTLEQWTALSSRLDKDAQYQSEGKDYLDAVHSDPPYLRMETILLQAFPGMTHLETPAGLKTPASERIYELRSYEGPTEKYFANKVQMFNKGDEIGLFKRLGFNAVFYASVLAGAHMPNLMYMTSFDNMEAREAHWKAFSADPYWKQLVADPQYQHNVSHVDIIFLHPAEYSDL
ncbi:NIPSNAP family protein [Flavitalea sp. BT771]|uniref:NIPSNAP family protein n=1 Tax=Flavitalea sp. BT771 TaxID=3063329 RepID=UPI0026E455E9|nr:NIPSNAP family protein [Flavitalea sp. BT771]MDO6432385.1 NIPSNAP family protein [Flavitalea sp. BT771]MDV6221295.1 NIPSNAP family protein [Flavitalea sp. BT771]